MTVNRKIPRNTFLPIGKKVNFMLKNKEISGEIKEIVINIYKPLKSLYYIKEGKNIYGISIGDILFENYNTTYNLSKECSSLMEEIRSLNTSDESKKKFGLKTFDIGYFSLLEENRNMPTSNVNCYYPQLKDCCNCYFFLDNEVKVGEVKYMTVSIKENPKKNQFKGDFFYHIEYENESFQFKKVFFSKKDLESYMKYAPKL